MQKLPAVKNNNSRNSKFFQERKYVSKVRERFFEKHSGQLMISELLKKQLKNRAHFKKEFISLRFSVHTAIFEYSNLKE